MASESPSHNTLNRLLQAKAWVDGSAARNEAQSKQTTNDSGRHANPKYDCLIVGAGFGGLYLLIHLRKLGYRCRIYEQGTDLGGTWHWNHYPGARVDSEIPVYEFSMPEAWKDWTWTEKYPDWREIRRYFQHIENVFDVKKDVEFHKKVVGAQFDTARQTWNIHTEDGQTTNAKFFLVCTGMAAKRYIPDFPGLETFKGEIHHSSNWPEEGVDVRGKRAAVIGTGASGVQICQEWAKEADELIVFQRTPNLALPMRQAKLTAAEQKARKSTYPDFFRYRETTFAGFQYDFSNTFTFDVSPEEREAFYESLYQRGGFAFWIANFADLLYDLKANREAYNFWAKKTRARITDPAKRDLLAPLEPIHPFGTKRPSLEQDYYEMLDKPHVKIVNVRQHKIAEVKPEGIVTSDGVLHEVDVIALATGFDAVSGSMMKMGLKSTTGMLLADEWKDGVNTYLGLAHHGYPNMFFLYGAHGPTAYSNGPSSIEMQARWIIDAIQKIVNSGLKSVEPTPEAEKLWKEKINSLSDMTLLPLADSWYMGANIPGKKREQLSFAGGLPMYEQDIRAALENWDGFVTVS
ncbi:hypothetical protein VTN49DRAFT_1994 [Thermomyces lanuginosus]|uniref:uncharacterized protein n=1 Tax=Thermomyces lanuginosus TaxID=5541 RepID=UPI0037433637